MGEEQHVIRGEVLDQHGNTVRPVSSAPPIPHQWAPPGAHPPPALPPRTRRRIRWKWVIAGTLAILCCIGTPAVGLFVWIGLPIIRETLDAGKGSNTPMEALVQLAFTFDRSDGDFLAPRYIVKSRRKEVLKVRADFIAARKADTMSRPDMDPGEIKIAGPQPGDPESDHGDMSVKRTRVLAYYAWSYAVSSTTGEHLWMSSGGLPWKAEVVKESDGWRIWSLELPPWCGIAGQAKSGYSRCDK